MASFLTSLRTSQENILSVIDPIKQNNMRRNVILNTNVKSITWWTDLRFNEVFFWASGISSGLVIYKATRPVCRTKSYYYRYAPAFNVLCNLFCDHFSASHKIEQLILDDDWVAKKTNGVNFGRQKILKILRSFVASFTNTTSEFTILYDVEPFLWFCEHSEGRSCRWQNATHAFMNSTVSGTPLDIPTVVISFILIGANLNRSTKRSN